MTNDTIYIRQSDYNNKHKEIGQMIINLTPHPVSIRRADGTFLALPKCDNPARCAVTFQDVTTADGIAVKRQVFGAVQNLPDPQDGTLFLVSLVVAQAANRSDLVSPGAAIRDANGVQIGCDGLSVL